jgi:hypothetical protein
MRNAECGVGSGEWGTGSAELKREQETIERNDDMAASRAANSTLRIPHSALHSPWQFSLRTLFLWTSALSVLFAIMAAVGARWSVLIGWFVLLIAAHVAANAWGSRAARRRRALGPNGDSSDSPLPAVSQQPTFAPTTRLGSVGGPGRGMVVVTVTGALAGLAIGGFLLWPSRPLPILIGGFCIGALSAAAVGGFVGYLASSFLDIALRAWAEAAQAGAPPIATRNDAT